MARFKVWAMPATFIDCGTHKMVSVAMGAPAIASQEIDVASGACLRSAIVEMAADLIAADPTRPFSMRHTLQSKRPPTGYRLGFFGLDHCPATESAK